MAATPQHFVDAPRAGGTPVAQAVRGARLRRGFTLLEVLVTVALIGLLAGVAVAGSVALLREKPATAEEVLRRAILEARRYALNGRVDVWLSFDNKTRTFHARTIEGEREVPVPLPGELQIDFLRAERTSTMLVGGDVVDTSALPYVTFYADGTCSPFRAQLRTGGPARFVTLDPWTCAPLLEAPK